MFGSSGTSGSNGATGTAGADGSSGTSGTNAPGFSSGTSGTSGVSGSSGSNGAAGTSGTNAPGFSSGTSGTSGASGSAGTSGTNAPGFSSGTSGTSGINGTGGSGGTSGTSVPGVTSGTSGTNGFPVTGTTNNGVLTYIDSPVGSQVESNLTFDGTNLSVTGNIVSSTYISSTTFRETYSDQGTGGSITFDLSTANNFRRQFNGTSTIAFSNPPVSNAFGFTLVVVNAGSYSITWPAEIDWVGGIAPILTSSGVDVLVFYTYNGGGSYYGFVTGKNLS
jgi:hypothetical protein